MFVPISTLNDLILTNENPSASVQDTKPNNEMIAGCISMDRISRILF
ncbi:hypothetical protein LEP1GSC171_0391 [Leptospira santarosai str. HAI1380]|uniref:Uncharacterized protein n=2 Tax=Leptospira santarosai TaxID=28183 RepID=M6UV72_9LEPT|nr:hypothetical protein LEP1GSC179_2120 [Leptospira santarosai str. MOR084]EKR90439.1 hypothetical protein LEP1GSC163_1707 [Leptospira santarosai str. CBC379]EMJ48771.1 hypothetical protein LEP1GSC169_1018 [Leptospira santarosai str. HAI1349]EMO23299.1 hypothetical protein LEP1GSC168_1012 [Leptospira santarosai str. HAI134]EMO44919.1 hypothetical protein LEP1GSC187_2416 [Leptospira santarosai str. ZUN179]EMO86805.1 hypothetical protein LEP1GSC070_3766 [Leptospira santarosai str. AIM]EMP01935.